MFFIACICVYSLTSITAHVWMSEDNLCESALSLEHMGPTIELQFNPELQDWWPSILTHWASQPAPTYRIRKVFDKQISGFRTVFGLTGLNHGSHVQSMPPWGTQVMLEFRFQEGILKS